MPHPPTVLAEAAASLRPAREAHAQAASTRQEGAAIALLLALLTRLFGPGIARQLRFLPIAEGESVPGCIYTGDRPLHVLAIEAGLLPGWLLRAHPARGMRPTPSPRPRQARRHPPPRAPARGIVPVKTQRQGAAMLPCASLHLSVCV